MTTLTPNLQLIYVSDIERSTAYYKMLFNAEPVFYSPRYVAFDAGGNALFALWNAGDNPDTSAPRFSEIGIMLKSNDEVDALYKEWKTNADIQFSEDIKDEVFGRTFLVNDPDGHIIRVCPLDDN